MRKLKHKKNHENKKTCNIDNCECKTDVDRIETYGKAADNLSQVVYETDANGFVIYINNFGLKLYGYSKKDLSIGINVINTVVPEQRDRVKNGIKNMIFNKKLSSDREYIALKKNGSTFPVLIYSTLVYKEDKVTGLRGFVIDLTQRKKTEKNMSQLNDKLLMLFRASTLLQGPEELEKKIELSVKSFESLGYKKVRVYFMKDEILVGFKSNYIDNNKFQDSILFIDNKKSKIANCIKKGQPVIERLSFKPKQSNIHFEKNNTISELIHLPMMSKGKCYGLITLEINSNEKSHNLLLNGVSVTDDTNILMTFVNQIAAAIENSDLYHKELKQLNQLRALYDISNSIASTLNLETLLSMIVIKIVKLLKADICSIYLLDESGKNLLPHASFDLRNIQNRAEVPVLFDKSISGKALKTNRIVYVPSVVDDDLYQNKKYAKDYGIKSLLSVPLFIEGVPVGVINIYTKKVRVFSNDEKELLTGLANHTAMIINNSKLYSRINQDKENFSALVDLSQIINSTFDLNELLEKILKKTVSFTNADIGLVMLKKDNFFEVKFTEPKNISKRYFQKIHFMQFEMINNLIKHKRAQIISSAKKQNVFKSAVNQAKSITAVPVLYKNEVIGIIYLESIKTDNFKYYRKTLDILTNHIAIAVDNIALYDEIKKFNIKLQIEIKAATKELMEKNLELQKLDQLKSDFVSNVSHELRTPLTSISGYTKLLLLEKLGTLNKKQINGLKIISEETDRLTRLINEVLDLSKMEAGKVELKTSYFDIVELAKESIDAVKMTALEKQINIGLIIKSGENKILGGKDMIKQVFINLISNALKFTDSRGKVEIIMRRTKTFYVVSVHDNGRGIPKDHLPKLFNRFVQVDSSMTREQGGTGLGLVIVKHILNLHNGTIKVDSEVGKGSTFTFYLPLNIPAKKNGNKKPISQKDQQLPLESF